MAPYAATPARRAATKRGSLAMTASGRPVPLATAGGSGTCSHGSRRSTVDCSRTSAGEAAAQGPGLPFGRRDRHGGEAVELADAVHDADEEAPGAEETERAGADGDDGEAG